MAKKVDCSDMAKLLYEILTEVSASPDVKSFDDAFLVMNGMIPQLTREGLSEAIIEFTEANKRGVNELQNKINRIRREPVVEKATGERIDALMEHLEEGTIPDVKEPGRDPSLVLGQLRETAKNLKKWVDSSDPVMREKLQVRLAKINKALRFDEDLLTEANRGKIHVELQGIVEEIKLAQKKVRNKKNVKQIEKQVKELQRQLDSGEIPTTKPIAREDDFAVAEMKAIREDLRRAIKKSDPVVKKKLQDTLDELDRRIKEGDIFPKTKIEVEESEATQKLRLEIAQRRGKIQAYRQELKPKTRWQKVRPYWDALRNWFATGEFSFVLRQGGAFTAAHPIRTMLFQPKLFKAFLNEKNYFKINSEIFTSKFAPLMHKAKLHLGSIDGRDGFHAVEEQIFGNIAEGIPVIGRALRAFDRAAVTYLNLIRAANFEIMINDGTIDGKPTKQEAAEIANYVNIATGRGDLHSFENSARTLADWVFSPRYAISRFQLLFLNPLRKSEGRARKAIAKEYARMMISVAAAMGLAEALRRAIDDEDKFDIEWDLRSSDFAKLRFGNRRVDLLAGVSQVAVLVSRLLAGETKSVRTGEISKTRGEDVKWGQRLSTDIIEDFVKYKASPLGRNFINFINGKTFDGPLTWQKVLEDNSLPITSRDILEAFQEEGMNVSTAISIAAFFGVGMNTYSDDRERLTIDKYLEDFGVDFQFEELGTLKEIVGID